MSFHAAVFIAVSLDGFIARPDGAIDWLTERGERAGDTGYDEFMTAIDTVVLGRNTYEKVLTFDFWPYEGNRSRSSAPRCRSTSTNASSSTARSRPSSKPSTTEAPNASTPTADASSRPSSARAC